MSFHVPNGPGYTCFVMRIVRSVILALVSLLFLTSTTAAQARPNVYVLNVKGVINPVIAEYVTSGIQRAEDQNASLVVIKLDTPGGLDTSMRDIVQAIIGSNVPIAVWVAPSGGRAASAGMFITISANIAAMAPGTVIGAATPIDSSGQDIGADLRNKVINDAAAYARELASRRGRNPDWAEKAVRDAVSASSSEAVDLHVVDFIAPSLDSLLQQSNGRTVTTAAGQVTINTENANITETGLDFMQQLLLVITDPTVAALLLGFAGIAIYFELANPGSILPGVVGGISLLLALYALGTLPTNWAAVGLVAFGFLLFFLEISITSHGILSIGGLTSITIGFLMLINSSAPYMQISRPAVFGLIAGLAAGMSAITVLAIRSRRLRVKTGVQSMIGQQAEVRQALAPKGMVFVDGELWEAVADGPVAAGERVRVLAVDGLTLHVARDAEKPQTVA